MTDVQMGVTAIGVGVLGAVVAYNRWVTWRSEPRHSQPPADAGKPATPGEGGPPFGQDGRVAPVLDGFAMAPQHAGERGAAGTERRALLDPLIDVHVTLALDHAVTGETVVAAMPRSRRIGSK